MTYLSLSRAARLAGVSRAELQRRIRRGEIETFEGAVAVEDLLRVYPAVSLTNDDALERVERIKRDALPKLDSGETVLPSPQVFLSRLRGLSKTLAERVAANEIADALLDQVGERLAALVTQSSERLPEALREIHDWFVDARRQLTLQPVPDERAQLLARDTFLRIMAAGASGDL